MHFSYSFTTHDYRFSSFSTFYQCPRSHERRFYNHGIDTIYGFIHIISSLKSFIINHISSKTCRSYDISIYFLIFTKKVCTNGICKSFFISFIQTQSFLCAFITKYIRNVSFKSTHK